MLAMDEYRKNSTSLIEFIWEGGRAEGKMEERTAVVRRMHALNYTIPQISDVTKLSESEIRRILTV